MARDGLLVDTDILIDYLKGIGPAHALPDSEQFTFYYSSWTKKELLAKPGLSGRERSSLYGKPMLVMDTEQRVISSHGYIFRNGRL